jgi:molybdopterin molybdotransferase
VTIAAADRHQRDAPSWAEARRTSFEAAAALPAEDVPVYEAVGRLLASDVAALHDIPHFSSSAMDGWAVAGDGPWTIVASPVGSLADGNATAIVTGSPVPPGTRGILRSENGELRDGRLVLGPRATPGEPSDGQHVRAIGEEAALGEIVVRSGTTLNPAHVAVIAGCGHDVVAVAPEPRVSLVFTGDEVIESGVPGPGQVRDSFGPQLPALVRMLGGRVAGTRRIGDDFAATVATLAEAVATSDLVITTGGTGHSPVDHLRAALTALGADLVIERIAMRPGSPTLLARLPYGRLVVGLPGNPLAAMMGMLTVVHPLLAALRGSAAPALGAVRSAVDIGGRPETTMLMPYRLDGVRALPNPWTGSGMMRGLADAAGVLVVPAGGLRAGESAETLTLPWL